MSEDLPIIKNGDAKNPIRVYLLDLDGVCFFTPKKSSGILKEITAHIVAVMEEEMPAIQREESRKTEKGRNIC